MTIRIITAAFESLVFSFTMFGVAHRKNVRPLYQHALFVIANTVMLYFLELNVFWEFILFYAVFLIVYANLFDVDLRTTAVGGVSTCIMVTINQLVTALIALLFFGERSDYRLIFRSTHWQMLFFSAFFAVGLIVLYNVFIAIPRRKAKLKHSFRDTSVRINLLLSFVLIFMLSWNLRYMYRNWENVNSMPGLSRKLILLVLFAAAMVGAMMLIVNRYLIKSMISSNAPDTGQRDVMTGTLNRDAGLAILKDMMKDSREKSRNLTICYVDVNNSKMVNDRFGQEEGDRLIYIVSKIISESLRTQDTLARLGGDEFVVMFSGLDEPQARTVWSRTLMKFKDINLSGELKFPVGISYGFVAYDSKRHKTVKALLRDADERMYKHKLDRNVERK